jgi:hypothetical protein
MTASFRFTTASLRLMTATMGLDNAAMKWEIAFIRLMTAIIKRTHRVMSSIVAVIHVDGRGHPRGQVHVSTT